MIAVLQAAKRGKVIQYRNLANGETWFDTDLYTAWNFAAREYRVKPKPREFWIIKLIGSKQELVWPYPPDDGDDNVVSCIHVREVLP